MNQKWAFLLAIFLLLLFPAMVYASSSHSSHGNSEINMSHYMDMTGSGAEKNITGGSMNMSGQEMKMDPNMDMGNGMNMANGSQDHNSGKSVLAPVKGDIAGGFAGLNALIIGAAALMKMKRGQGA